VNETSLAAEHFNALNALIPALYGDSSRFVACCRDTLGVVPVPGDFAAEFVDATRAERPGVGSEALGSP
jgi:hypothetical protein